MKSRSAVGNTCLFCILFTPAILARSYYVSTSGSDANLGTLDSPLRSIQKAASLAVAGDVVFVRAGTYRETVAPARSGTQAAPITFQPYNNESVTISGADVIPTSAWSQSSGNIYKAPMAWDLGEGSNQIFLDGQMMIEARWPNTTLDVSHPTLALTGGGSYADGAGGVSTGSLTGLDLPTRPAGYWNGATIHISPFNVTYNQGPGWSWQTGTVVNSTASQLSFTWTRWVTVEVPNPLVPGPKNPYYLSGKLGELDASGEWFFDSSTLYFWAPAGDNPAQHLVEAKRRVAAFNLNSRSFITIQGFNIFAATITSDASSQYLVLDGLKAQYVWHYSLIPSKAPHVIGLPNSGILLFGSNNVIRNSSIAFSAGNGISVTGTGHRVFNNSVHDADYSGGYPAPISSTVQPTSDVIIAWNTVYNAGRFGILHSIGDNTFSHGRILHNEVYGYGIQTSDLGCIYTFGSDGNGTEIAYNVCHNDTPQNLLMGLYLDFNSSSHILHHNLVWGPLASLRMNTVSRSNKVYNNTFASTLGGLLVNAGLDGVTQMPDSELKNNIFTTLVGANASSSGAVLQNNILPGTNPQFVDSAQNNYQLKTNSPAIDAGLTISPYTDGFIGRAPDIGAFESGAPAWKAGGGQGIASPLSAASYGTAVAPESIAIAFGTKLGTGNGDSGSTLPTTLAGTKVVVTDGAGMDRLAPLFYVRPTQLAFEIPPGTAPGIALITVTSGDGTISLGSAPVFPTAPALFSANATGTGVAAANLIRVKADNSQTLEQVATFDAGQNQFVPLAIDRGAATDQLALVLYGSGVRNHGTSSSAVIAVVGGVNAQVLYAGSQGLTPGLDQVNILLPRNLPSGMADIVLTVDGIPANTVTIAMR